MSEDIKKGDFSHSFFSGGISDLVGYKVNSEGVVQFRFCFQIKSAATGKWSEGYWFPL